jgi:hypothetical protein
MPEAPFPLSKPSLAYAKLVATPTDTSWSQVYNAGNLFACVSLTIEEPGEEDISLPAIGKEVLDTLQAEFFVLEKKDIASIADVIQKSIHHVKEPVSVDVSLGFFKDNILYLFLVGRGRVMMKRKGKIGKLIESKRNHKEIITASGYLHNEDTVIIETKQFADDITDQALAAALDLAIPNDIAEALSPKLHENADGGQAAIIVTYHGISGGVIDDVPEHDEDTLPTEHPHAASVIPQQHHHVPEYDNENDEADDEEEESNDPKRKQKFAFPKLASLSFLSGLSLKLPKSDGLKLTHSRKLFLSITIILIVLLAVSIFFTKKKQSDEKQQEQFKQVYEPAEKKYEDGKALETLNKDLSTQDFIAAKQLLESGSSQFPAGSAESKQIQDLLSKVQAELSTAAPVENAKAAEAKVADNSLLAVEKSNLSGLGFTQDDKAVYFVTDKAVVSVSKSSGNKSDLIKNSGDWVDAIGIATYQGNFYILDRKKGVVKFVAGGGGYGAASYFKDKPDMSKARDLAIDSSIYILMTDGTVLKYTSGSPDTYKPPALEKPVASPAKIFTDASTKNLYILDRGNSRVIKIEKDGADHAEYVSSIIKNAQDFEVNENNKKILILSDGKFWEIAL